MSKRLTNPFNAFCTCKGQKGFDTDYIERHITKVVHKTGPGENDYIIIDKVVDIKKNIQDFIDVDKDNVGIYNLLNQLVRTEGNAAKDKIIAQALDQNSVNIHGCNDFTDAPVDLMDCANRAIQLEKFYQSLPKEITKGKKISEFFANFTGDEIKGYFGGLYEKIIKDNQRLTEQKKVTETPKAENKAEEKK